VRQLTDCAVGCAGCATAPPSASTPGLSSRSQPLTEAIRLPTSLCDIYRSKIEMPPTIRIDDDVYKWLQSQAIPFEDNPNSVLRRLAGLDRKVPRGNSAGAAGRATATGVNVDSDETDSPPVASSLALSRGSKRMAETSPAMREQESIKAREAHDSRGRRLPLARGADLIRRWKIPARQARFHRDGSWYEGFDRFPAAYCDRYGYVLFGSVDDLRTTPGIRIEPSGQVWVPGGISGIAGYRKTDDPIADPNDPEQP
jgi:hypothetical protein